MELIMNHLYFEKNSVIDPHFWFDINLWKISFMYLGDNLKVLFPKHQAEFDYRVTNYLKQLDELNNEASKIMQTIPASNRFLVAEYDAYRYIARMYKIQTFSFSKFFNSAGNERNTMDSFFSIMCALIL